jgi:uncharacterized protein (DUF2252 family)
MSDTAPDKANTGPDTVAQAANTTYATAPDTPSTGPDTVVQGANGSGSKEPDKPYAGRKTVEERRQAGRALRKDVPRSSHGRWAPDAYRADPVTLLEEQNQDRLPWLVPIRRGRMADSAFTFYRGAARVMSSDLGTTPSTGLTVQSCGDAHLSNFGAYASPERTLVFDVNDFDETLPAPWEWDVKRMATSFVIAGRNRGFDRADCRAATARSVEAYRQAMADLADVGDLDIWYAHLTVDRIAQAVKGKRARRVDEFSRKAQSKNNLQALSKLSERVDGHYRIKSDPPVLLPLRDLSSRDDPSALRKMVVNSFVSYRSNLDDDRKRLLDRYTPIDIALKVVGVGSVGTRCLILLLEGRDADDPLFLQIKQATASVLEEHLPESLYGNHGERVVQGQRLMQTANDIFLGWSEPQESHHYYWRQLKDWKGSVDIDEVSAEGLGDYADVCGWTLAHAHARSGDPVAIAGYLGQGDVFIDAIGDFAEAYADQSDADYDLFKTTIDDGRLEADHDD